MKEYSYGVCPYRLTKFGVIQILLIQPKGHSDWGFIKGKIEKNESKEECAKRECAEETNILFDENHLEDYFMQMNKRKDVGIFLINIDNIDVSNIKLQKGEVHKIRYFDINFNVLINKNQQTIFSDIRNTFLNRGV